MYNPDLTKLPTQLTPRVLRQVRNLAWLKVLVKPIGYISGLLQTYIINTRLELSYNGQTIILKKALNNKWPLAAGGIYIDHASVLLPIQFAWYKADGQGDAGFIYYQSEGQPSSGFAYYQSEYLTQIHFKVKVPAALVYDVNEMKATVNRYKQAGKRYIIENY